MKAIGKRYTANYQRLTTRVRRLDAELYCNAKLAGNFPVEQWNVKLEKLIRILEQIPHALY